MSNIIEPSLIGGLGIIGIITFYYILQLHKLDKKEKLYQDNVNWLKEEMLKPKYVVKFVIKSLDSTNVECSTTVCEPYNTAAGCEYWNIRYSSKSLAESHLRTSYERGFFQSKEGISYPSCNVLKAYVEVENE